MRISAKAIINYSDINSFSFANQWSINEGDSSNLYFQLVDLDRSGLRYLLGIGSSNQPYSVNVTFPSNQVALNTYSNATNQGFAPILNTLNFPTIDSSLITSFAGIQADANDPSVWKAVIPAGTSISSGNVLFSVTQGSNVTTFNVINLLQVQPLNPGSC